MAIKTHNGMTYDDSIDYSAAIEQAKKSGQDTTQLEAARQAKIDDKYKGVEPVMYGSNQTYKQATANNDNSYQADIDNAVRISSKVNNYDYASPSVVNTNPKDYDVVYGRNAAGGLQVNRDQNYAGQSVKMGNFTVTFNNDGYVHSVRNDGGASATSNVVTNHANDTIFHKLAYDAAAKGEWDLASQYMNMMADTYQRTGVNDGYTTGIDYKAADLYNQELRNQFGYNANAYYNRRYDEAYGPNAAAVWDATGGAVRTYSDLVNIVGAEKANEMIQNQIDSNPSLYNNPGSRIEGTYTPVVGGAQTSGLMAGGVAQSGSSYPVGGSYSYTGGFGVNDMTQYLKDMYAQDLEAQLAGLASGYEQSAAEIRAQDDLINNQYQQAMNQAAAQNDLERLYMNEMGIMNGLNTGATGQLALGQSMAYQGNLANLGAAQAQDLAANNRLLSQLTSQYNNAVAQATANTNSALNNALYQEMLRQEEIAREEALAQQKLAQQAQDNARETALTWISNGVMPGADVLAAAGMTQNEANIWYQVANGVSSAQYNSAPAVNTNPVSAPAPAPAPAPSRVDNEGLSDNIIKALQRNINQYLPAGQKIAEDGKWGPATAAAAGGLTAREYYNAYEDYRAG
jgi:hypothetical protein